MPTQAVFHLFRRAVAALAALAFCAAPGALANDYFPQNPDNYWDKRRLDQIGRDCAAAGHAEEEHSNQVSGQEECGRMRACRFAGESPASGARLAGCFFSWDLYHPFQRIFRGPRCFRDQVVRNDDWAKCLEVIPAECPAGTARTLNGGATENPFAPCAAAAQARRGPAGPDAEINRGDRAGRTALHLAVIRGRQGEARNLLEQGADPNLQDNRGESSLHYAFRARADREAMAALLLEHDADPNLSSRGGVTPLHFAALSSPEGVEMMLAAGADRDAADRRGRTPLDVARSRGREDIAAILTR